MPPVGGPNDAKRPGEGHAGRTSNASPPTERTSESRQSGVYPPALVRPDPGGHAVDLPPRVRVPGDHQDWRHPIAGRRDSQERRQAVARNEEGGRPRRAEALVHAVRKPDCQSRLSQVRKERLTNRIGVGTDDDSNRSKDEDVHASVEGRSELLGTRTGGGHRARALQPLTHAAAFYDSLCFVR